MKVIFYLAALLLGTAAVAEETKSTKPVYPVSGPCQYCNYCVFCQDCEKCPCTTEYDHCEMCTYCKFCTFCNSICPYCEEGSVLATLGEKVLSMGATLASYLPGTSSEAVASFLRNANDVDRESLDKKLDDIGQKRAKK